MPPSNFTYTLPTEREPSVLREDGGNGFIWHTTGSGKTRTSFKASTLLKDNPAAKRGFRDRRQQTFFLHPKERQCKLPRAIQFLNN